MSVSVVMPSGGTSAFPAENGITSSQLKRLIAQKMTDSGFETCDKHFYLTGPASAPIADSDIIHSGQSVTANMRANGGGCTCQCRCNIL